MGLDITAYKGLKKEKDLTKLEDSVDWYDFCEENNIEKFNVNIHYPERAKEIDSNFAYSFEGSFGGVRGKSYGGYNRWRNQLAQLAGHPSDEYVWNNYQELENKAFIELICFSDCEGIIGTEVSKKLAKDFQEFDERALQKGAQIGDFHAYYEEMKKAFEFASENGCVRFH